MVLCLNIWTPLLPLKFPSLKQWDLKSH